MAWNCGKVESLEDELQGEIDNLEEVLSTEEERSFDRAKKLVIKVIETCTPITPYDDRMRRLILNTVTNSDLRQSLRRGRKSNLGNP